MRSHSSAAGFTLIELLVVIGILGLLATITIIAINPSKQLDDAKNAERILEAKAIENGMTQYIIDEWSAAAISEQSVSLAEGVANAVPICATSVIESDSCFSVYFLVPEYIAQVPNDPMLADEMYSGYCVYLHSSRYRVFSAAMMPEGGACGGVEAMMDGGDAGGGDVAENEEGLSSTSAISASVEISSSISSSGQDTEVPAEVPHSLSSSLSSTSSSAASSSSQGGGPPIVDF